MSTGGGPERTVDAPVEPVCPRHPERVSYVRCQRCDRPACPQCQRQAAVGVQCIDCVREQARSAPVARTTFGGRAADGRPLVTTGLVAACALVFVLQQVGGVAIYQQLAFSPSLAASEPWRFVSAAFLHAGLLHILFNMVALWQIGSGLEPAFGRARFLALYLISAVGGSTGFLLLADPGDPSSWFAGVVGASGAVFGLFGALLLVNRRLRLDQRPLLALLVVNAVIGFLPGTGIAWQAHLGGLVTGAACAAVLVYAPARRRSLLQLLGLAGVALVVVALAVLKLILTTGL